jgi:cyclopropane fatty-acyl-phospholipid synthase-like methyltransferase
VSAERSEWLRKLRRTAEEGYDRLEGTTYYEGPEGHIPPMHHRFASRLISLCPPGGRILDAACGSGRYLALALDAGRVPVGADQSGGMLARARESYPSVQLEKVGLQELAFDREFHGAMSIDAMEFVFPEDWPVVVANLHRALRSSGHVYMTVEQVNEDELDRAHKSAKDKGFPAVWGENILRGGYHYYPSKHTVAEWIRDAGLQLVQDDYSDHGTYGYYHLLAQKSA